MAEVPAETNEEPVDNEVGHKQTSSAQQQAIFVAVRTTMIDGKLKHGIFSEVGQLMGFSPETVSRQWRSMNDKLVGLLDNHPNGEHAAIIVVNHHILFDTDHVGQRKGRYKYDREALRDTIKEIPFKGRHTIPQAGCKVESSCLHSSSGKGKENCEQGWCHPREDLLLTQANTHRATKAVDIQLCLW